MRQRIAGLIGEEGAREATIGTFHAICARILRRDGEAIGLTRSFTIYDRADQMALVKTVLKNLDLDEKRFGPAGMLAWIGQRKDELADVATASKQAANYYDETAARVYAAYQRQLAEDDAVDFDDLLMRVVFLFEQHPAVLARYQQRWQQILVDEYQDTNRAQYLICRQLAAKHKNLAVVGRRRPEHLLLARRGPAQHPRLRGRLPRRQGREARAELPIDPDDPRRGPRRRQPQRGPQGQEALDRSRRRRADHAVRRLQRVRGGRVRRAPGREARRRRAPRRDDRPPHQPGRRRGRVAALRRHRGRVPDQRPVPRARRVADALRHPVPARGRRPLLRASRGEGRPRLRPPGPQSGGPRRAAADHQRAGAGDRREDRRGAHRLGRVARHLALGGGAGRRRESEPRDPVSRAARRLRRAHAGPDGDGGDRAAVGDLRRRPRALRPPGGDPGRDR